MSTKCFRKLALSVCALTVSMSAVAGETKDDANDPPIAATATIKSVECYQCVQWPGSGATTRVADKLVAIVQTPAEFAGRQISVFVWNDIGKSQIWLPDSTLSFTAFGNMLSRDKAVFPLSETRFVAK
jgi:hypothetical protein